MSINYDSKYFEINYEIRDNVVRRTLISEEEKPDDKHKCLVACIKHFTGINVDNKNDLLDNFHCKDGIVEFDERRCCCSQEEPNLRCFSITYIETNLSFIVGGVCFKRLFAFDDKEWRNLRFLRPDCKYCGEKVKRNMINTPTKGFCNRKCLKDYNDREEQIRKKKEWDDGEPEREAKRIAREEEEKRKKKEWDDGAPEREARIAENEEKIRVLELEKIEMKKKFPYGQWYNCQGCDVEKKTDFERKYKWCKKCGKK
jgi:hypothetical protein